MITGHSLGAGTANLVALELMLGPGGKQYLPKGTRVQCVALAPPPIYRSDRELPKRVRDSIDIYINGQVIYE